MPRLRFFAAAGIALLTAAAALPSSAQTLRVAMTAADLPTTTGIPNNGGEGYRFCGFTAFDSLINWDFTHPDRIATPTPGLATEWKIDEADHTRWMLPCATALNFTTVRR